MVSIFDYADYRTFIESWIADQPSGGRGLRGRLATAAGVSSSLISLILKGEKHLTMEQASDVADFIGLNETEADYFFLLVQIGKAGSVRLRKRLTNKAEQVRKQARQISKRVKKDLELTDSAKAIFYSGWLYTGIRNLLATGPYTSPAAIAERLNVPTHHVTRALEFLTENQLVRQEKGRLVPGPAYTHIEADSPLVIRHHQNWRVKGFQQMETSSDTDLFYTCPMSLSVEDVERIRSTLLSTIDECLRILRPSPSETVHCLNIDWFKY